MSEQFCDLARNFSGYPMVEPVVIDEEMPITFRTAAEALRFADGLLHGESDKTKVAVGMLRKKYGGRVPFSELKDMAHTISIEVARLPYPISAMFRAVHGRQSTIIGLCSDAARVIWRGPGEGKVAERKTIAQTRTLVCCCIQARRNVANGWDKVQMKTYMEAVEAASRQQFYEQWGEDRRRAFDLIDLWCTQADEALSPVLRHLGIVE